MADHYIDNAVFNYTVNGKGFFYKTLSLLAADFVNADSIVFRLNAGPFPEGTFVLAKDFRSKIGELDTNATPTGTLSIGFGGIDGDIDAGKALVTDHDAGAAEAWVSADAGIEEVIDVSGLYPIITFTAAAATAADGDLTLYMELVNAALHQTVTKAA